MYYLDNSGTLQTTRGHYDAAAGMVSFVTTRFPAFMVGYNKVAFSDVRATDWYGGAVSFAAARGIVSGTGGGLFGPGS